MHSRIAPRNDAPEHSVEIGYLRDLTTAIKVTYYHLEDMRRYSHDLSIDLIGGWQVHRANLIRCEGMGSPRPTFDRSKHQTEVEFVDTLLARISQGITEGNPIAHITETHIATLERCYRSISTCRHQMIWY